MTNSFNISDRHKERHSYSLLPPMEGPTEKKQGEKRKDVSCALDAPDNAISVTDYDNLLMPSIPTCALSVSVVGDDTD